MSNDSQYIEFRSTLDFRQKSWLSSQQEFKTGLFKESGNTDYSIFWSSALSFELNDDSGHLQIAADNWSIPFELKIESSYFTNIESDNMFAQDLHKFLSHFIDCVEHICIQIDVLKFRLDGRPIMVKIGQSSSWRRLSYKVMQINLADIFEEYALLQDNDHIEETCRAASQKESREVSWQFLIDAIASFNAGHYRGAVIYACCAVEIEIAPAIREWIIESSYSQPSSLIDTTLMNLGNPIKFEIFFGRADGDNVSVLSKSNREKLLQHLKSLNSLRNRVVHAGANIQPGDAYKAIQVAGLLVRINWVKKRQEYFKNLGIPDVFSDFGQKLRNTDI